MTGIPRTSTLAPAAAATRAPVAPPAATLSAAEQAQIADAFPARPQVAQRLYGGSGTVQTAATLGSHLDLRG